MSDKETVGSALTKLAVILLTAFGVGVLRAVVLRELWAMFVVPAFAVATPSLPATYGMLLGVSVLTSRPPTKRESDEADISWRSVLRAPVWSVSYVLTAWGIGALLAWWW